MKKLRKAEVVEHVKLICDEYDFLEENLTKHKFMAADYVSEAKIGHCDKRT